MNPFDLNLFWFNPLVHLLMEGLRLFATPFQGTVSAGVAGGLAIILFTIAIRLVLLPLSLQQVRSMKAQMSIQPEMKALQKKFKGDREGMAKAQMQLYRERGVNPAAGCLPLLVQMPILFAMYSAMLNLSTQGLTLDQVQLRDVSPSNGTIVYDAGRTEHPQPTNQFQLFTFQVTPRPGVNTPIDLNIPQEQTEVSLGGVNLLAATQGLTLTPGQVTNNPSAPNTPNGKASVYLRPGGTRNPDGTFNRNVPVQAGEPYWIEVEVNAPQTRVDHARVTVTTNPALVDLGEVQTPPLLDVPFKSAFLWLPGLGEPDVVGHVAGLGIPGLLLILMTITSFISQRMSTIPSDDPQQRAMMQSMAFMPLMYLFFFLSTPAGLVIYWLVSNVFTMVQTYFTTGLGMFAGDLQKVTGRDFQPPWAHVPVAATAGADDSSTPAHRGGRARSAAAYDESQTTSANGQGVDGAKRSAVAPSRTGGGPSSKGRKRGKR